tara:strand:+ start:247 stop:627 length:381 start_codon:yes stop_codon:yes gene_type:complete
MGEILKLKKNDIRFNINLNEDHYNKINEIIKINSGKTISELKNLIKFYEFTEKSLEYALKLFNTHQCSFYNICGPFICIDNKWYLFNNSNNSNIYTIKNNNNLKKENLILKKEIIELKSELRKLNL